MAEPLPILPDDQEPTFRGFLTGHGGVQLAFARWEHPAPRGRVVIAHGYGEHGERYRHLAHALLRQGWSVSSLDHRGFGRSGGRRGDSHGIRGPVEDLTGFLRQERRLDTDSASAGTGPEEALAAPARPQVLLGHSYGGLLAALTLLWHPETLDGLILSSPAIGLRPFPFLLGLLRKLMFRLGPHVSLDLPNDKAKVCSDPVFVQRYWDDPLCHRTITSAFVEALEEGRDELLPLGAELDRPILLLEAGLDTVADPDAAERLWQAVRPELLERHRLEGVRHEIFHDLLRGRALELTKNWLDRVFPIRSGTIAPLTATFN